VNLPKPSDEEEQAIVDAIEWMMTKDPKHRPMSYQVLKWIQPIVLQIEGAVRGREA
jgi:hypothetical protein